jgi:hypothetical protein
MRDSRRTASSLAQALLSRSLADTLARCTR